MAGAFETSIGSVGGKYLTSRNEQYDLMPKRMAEMKTAKMQQKELSHRKLTEAEARDKKRRLSGNYTAAQEKHFIEEDDPIRDFHIQQYLNEGEGMKEIRRLNYGGKK